MSLKSLCLSLITIIILCTALTAGTGYSVKRVNFLERYGLSVNGSGPLLVRADPVRDRLVLINTNTSSVSLVDGPGHNVTNIPIQGRIPQYVKSSALAIHQQSGTIYIIGNKQLHIVLPAKKESVSIATEHQYDMVAVSEKTGTAFMVGRASPFLAMISPDSGTVEKIKWLEHSEEMTNLNATPPPPIRKVVCDDALNRVIAIDGFTASLHQFNAKNGKFIKKRPINTCGGTRWHMAGYNKKTHHLYVVVETDKRKVVEALKIGIKKEIDLVAQLPGLTEGVGVIYNPKEDEVYIPYDNHPSVHVVNFKQVGNGSQRDRIEEIKVPNFGNDASAIDIQRQRLYVSSWGYGDINVIDLKTRKLIKRIPDTGVIPHMFNMALMPARNKLYIPIGATAVNGSFGASLDVLNLDDDRMSTIYTGWAPVAMEALPGGDVMVFNSENEAARVTAQGKVTYLHLPSRFTNSSASPVPGKIHITYGPHQSYWPTVYIWAAKNGILSIDTGDMSFYDRRLPRMSHGLAFDKNGVCYALQNSWGKEELFLASFPDDVRYPNLGSGHIKLKDFIQRETTPRILKYDRHKHWLYIVRTGEKNNEPGVLQIYDIEQNKVRLSFPTGLTPTDLEFDGEYIYIANFDSGTVTRVNKTDFSVTIMKAGQNPFDLALTGTTVHCIDHNAQVLLSTNSGKFTAAGESPLQGRPDSITATGTQLIITAHTSDTFYIYAVNSDSGHIETLHRFSYPYGETTVDTDNSSFFMRGQLGDGIFRLNQVARSQDGTLWISDYLSGGLFILKKKSF